MYQKLVSVIIPVYNVEQYLNKCIKSIMNQTYQNWELILVDDGSMDNSSVICDDWAEKDKRIQVIHKSNGGLSDARNTGFNVSKGEYISFIDSDDWVEPDFIETLALHLDQGADIADCATRLCDEQDNTLFVRGFSQEKVLDTQQAMISLIKESGMYQTVWNKLYKRDVIVNIYFPRGKYNEDDFWTWKVFRNAKNVSVSPKPLYNYLQRKGSIMGNSYSLRRLDELEARFEMLQALESDAALHNLCLRKCIFALIYSLQMSLKYLPRTELTQAKKIILSYVSKCSPDNTFYKNCSKKFIFWSRMFFKCPVFIAKIRNILGIGI